MKKRLLIIIVIGFLSGYVITDVVRSLIQSPAPPPIPTKTEIQQMLVDRGYSIKVDGIIGKETLKAWDLALCEQAASEWDSWYKERK